ncbi:zinc finger, GRF-type containing protein [Tanacetum coccineum]|uniref:Zinc finger, GRF-type containing protein n=1 Tax=Tanacetum coccineum TaxID=301880 RepID=A0ABQ4XPE8_9ASTR
MAARCACGLEAVIRTSWTNRNPGRRFYGCPTPIITGLLRSRNELEKIVAMVEEKRRKEVAFLLDVLSRRAIIEELERLPRNLVACKTREHLKRVQKVVFVEVIELKKELRLQVPP